MRFLIATAAAALLCAGPISAQAKPKPKDAPAADAPLSLDQPVAPTPVSRAEAKTQAAVERIGKVSAAFFLGLQELPPFTPEQMTARHEGASGDAEALAADTALNDWKLCALGSIDHWAELKAGRGEIVDGAMGRCADLEREYRNHLTRITQDGRFVLDLQFARSMMKSLEDTWRPRLLAAALDRDLAVLQAEPPKVERRR